MKEISVFGDLLGETILDIQRNEGIDGNELIFTLDNGEQYRLFHSFCCCEIVYIADIIGELADLIGAPLLMAEEVSHSQVTPDGMPKLDDEYFTWTFYKMATVKGYVTIRWYGTSNGYYSESVDFEKLEQWR